MPRTFGFILAAVLVGPASVRAVGPADDALPALARRHLADYDAELRRPNGRVDSDRMVERLKTLGVTTYYWLIWHAYTDWEDLREFLPKAARADIDVWVYLVPPSESPPQFGRRYSEPFRLDYALWAEEIARLSLRHPNLTAWVIDDFFTNRAFFTPERLREMRGRARAVNPRLAFLPLLYLRDLKGNFVQTYRELIDGAVVAFLEDRGEIEEAWAALNDAGVPATSELSFPPGTGSRSGDFAAASLSARVTPGASHWLRFHERDDFTGPTAGFHVKQLLVDGAVAWEADVAGGHPGWHEVEVDLAPLVQGKDRVTLAFRLLERKGVSNFGVRWRLSDLRAEGLEPAADLVRPEAWETSRRGGFVNRFGKTASTGLRRFHIPFYSMTAADLSEFRDRHGNPPTTVRVARQLRLSLDAWRDGKCDGVVTYCLDKRSESPTFAPIQALFREYAAGPPMKAPR